MYMFYFEYPSTVGYTELVNGDWYLLMAKYVGRASIWRCIRIVHFVSTRRDVLVSSVCCFELPKLLYASLLWVLGCIIYAKNDSLRMVRWHCLVKPIKRMIVFCLVNRGNVRFKWQKFTYTSSRLLLFIHDFNLCTYCVNIGINMTCKAIYIRQKSFINICCAAVYFKKIPRKSIYYMIFNENLYQRCVTKCFNILKQRTVPWRPVTLLNKSHTYIIWAFINFLTPLMVF